VKIMDDLSWQHAARDQAPWRTAALVKPAAMMAGECIFGMFGPLLFLHHLSWFDINFPGAVMLGVVVGAGVGYAVATAALHLYRSHTAAARDLHPMLPHPV
jgi:hypothetical protein